MLFLTAEDAEFAEEFLDDFLTTDDTDEFLDDERLGVFIGPRNTLNDAKGNRLCLIGDCRLENLKMGKRKWYLPLFTLMIG